MRLGFGTVSWAEPLPASTELAAHRSHTGRPGARHLSEQRSGGMKHWHTHPHAGTRRGQPSTQSHVRRGRPQLGAAASSTARKHPTCTVHTHARAHTHTHASSSSRTPSWTGKASAGDNATPACAHSVVNRGELARPRGLHTRTHTRSHTCTTSRVLRMQAMGGDQPRPPLPMKHANQRLHCTCVQNAQHSVRKTAVVAPKVSTAGAARNKNLINRGTQGHPQRRVCARQHRTMAAQPTARTRTHRGTCDMASKHTRAVLGPCTHRRHLHTNPPELLGRRLWCWHEQSTRHVRAVETPCAAGWACMPQGSDKTGPPERAAPNHNMHRAVGLRRPGPDASTPSGLLRTPHTKETVRLSRACGARGCHLTVCATRRACMRHGSL
jgi:hypothetical protein